MSAEPDALERAAWDALAQEDVTAAAAALDQATALRTAADAGDPGLIWTLSLRIETLRRRHTIEAARAAAAVGEQRLILRRRVLAAHPLELAHALDDLARLYVFEEDAFDLARKEALEAEARALRAAEG